ncbi:MAG: carbohydrate ABC transporter permease, partial [Clostridia bacterium]|nr:carbohydrate ABC transporter permease [Clostridia bacterium]
MAREKKEITTVELNGKTITISSGPVGVYRTAGSVVFDIINYVVIAIAAFTTVMPIIYVFFNSFATEFELQTRPMFVFPHTWSTDAYKYIFASPKLLRAFGNSVFISFFGTLINLFCTVTMAYPLSKKFLRGRKFLLNMVLVSMFFSGGMIPGYVVVSSWLGLRGTYWAILLPGAISAYNML